MSVTLGSITPCVDMQHHLAPPLRSGSESADFRAVRSLLQPNAQDAESAAHAKEQRSRESADESPGLGSRDRLLKCTLVPTLSGYSVWKGEWQLP
jgi:hypothetical protein